MAPSESSILSNFLLPPAPLPAVISLRKFKELFPSAQQSDPQIAILYRELQQQRATDTDDVKRNIEAEVRRGEIVQRAVSRARRRANKEQLQGLDQRELQMDLEVLLHVLRVRLPANDRSSSVPPQTPRVERSTPSRRCSRKWSKPATTLSSRLPPWKQKQESC